MRNPAPFELFERFWVSLEGAEHVSQLHAAVDKFRLLLEQFFVVLNRPFRSPASRSNQAGIAACTRHADLVVSEQKIVVRIFWRRRVQLYSRLGRSHSPPIQGATSRDAAFVIRPYGRGGRFLRQRFERQLCGSYKTDKPDTDSFVHLACFERALATDAGLTGPPPDSGDNPIGAELAQRCSSQPGSELRLCNRRTASIGR